EDKRLADFFGGHKVMLRIPGYSNPMEYLIAEGYLARPIFVPLESGVELSGGELIDLVEMLDIPAQILERLAKHELRNLKIVLTAEELLNRHRRILLFAVTVGHARLLATVLRARGHLADVITSETDELSRAL